jgi:hypothetical protein
MRNGARSQWVNLPDSLACRSCKIDGASAKSLRVARARSNHLLAEDSRQADAFQPKVSRLVAKVEDQLSQAYQPRYQLRNVPGEAPCPCQIDVSNNIEVTCFGRVLGGSTTGC